LKKKNIFFFATKKMAALHHPLPTLSLPQFEASLQQSFQLLTPDAALEGTPVLLISFFDFHRDILEAITYHKGHIYNTVEYGPRFQDDQGYRQYVLFTTEQPLVLASWYAGMELMYTDVQAYVPLTPEATLPEVFAVETVSEWYAPLDYLWNDPNAYQVYNNTYIERPIEQNSDLQLTDYVSERRAYELWHQLTDLADQSHLIAATVYPLISKDFLFDPESNKAFKYDYATKTWLYNGQHKETLVSFLALVGRFGHDFIRHWQERLPTFPNPGAVAWIQRKLVVAHNLIYRFSHRSCRCHIVSQLLKVAALSSLLIRSFNEPTPWLPIGERMNVNVITGEVAERRIKDRVLHFCQVNWRADPADMAVIHQVLWDIASHDKETLRDIRVFCNMALQGRSSHEVVIFHIGGPVSGQSLVIQLLFAILGPNYMLRAEESLVTDQHQSDFADLEGKRVVVIDKCTKVDEWILKTLIYGNDLIVHCPCKFPRQIARTFLLCLFANQLPDISHDEAGSRLVVTIPWQSAFVSPVEYDELTPEQKNSGKYFVRDDQLWEKLRQPHMLSAFLAYIVLKGGNDFHKRTGKGGYPFYKQPMYI
jgi:phage/plasmid-associated DNA primase